MALQDFIPRRDGDLDSMEDNLAHKLPTYAATLGIDPAEITAVIIPNMFPVR
jgi:hypothetical protein